MLAISRTFTFEDQQKFANLSGDYNPIHIDPVVSRRLMFGQPIVHGIHLLLWALCEQGKAHPFRTIVSLSAVFRKPVPVKAEVDCQWIDSGESSQIKIFLKGNVVTQIDVVWSPECSPLPSPSGETPPVANPIDRGRCNLLGTSGSLELYLSQDLLDSLLPDLSRQSPHSQIASLLATTRLVGNQCPGLNSLYSSLKMNATDVGESTTLDFSVTSFDKRFSATEIKLDCPGWQGSAHVFVRPPPTAQADYTAIAKSVAPGEFGGLKAIIIGGSRGLGEVFAKLLCAGGAEVTITYFRGAADAERVVRDVSSGNGLIEAIQLDVTEPLNTSLPKPDLLVYCSTPFIFGAAKGQFSSEKFSAFCAHYVDGFNRICSHFAGQSPLKVIYPSSSAIDEIPDGMGEYAASKSAGEVLCEYLEKRYRGLMIHRPRLSRLATDQTASIVPIHNEAPAPVLLRELRVALGR